jgi:hypothetical protein
MGIALARRLRQDSPLLRARTGRTENMNRQKKLQQLFKEKAKKASAKLAPKKPKYISKAERAKLEAEAAVESIDSSES